MNSRHFNSVSWTAIAFLLFLSPFCFAYGQEQTPVARQLLDLKSPTLDTRIGAFYLLVRSMTISQDTGRQSPLSVMTESEKELVTTALIETLEREGRNQETREANGEDTSEAFSNYWGDLVMTVGLLRDPRAAKGLISALGTGGMATELLGDLCPGAIEPLLEVFHGPEVYSLRNSPGKRGRAIWGLGECFSRPYAMSTEPEALRKAMDAMLEALDDADPVVRIVAIGEVRNLRNDPRVRSKLLKLANEDSYEVPNAARLSRTAFPARERAASVLIQSSSAGEFYVMRHAAEGECRVQSSLAPPIGDRLIGPFSNPALAKVRMCSHVDQNTTNTFLCRKVFPAQVCSQ